MRGLTTVARLPGSGNGRHAALEAQDLGKPLVKEDAAPEVVTLPDVMRAVQAHMLALADAIGLTPEQRELLERKMLPVFNCRSTIQPITLTFKVTDLSDEDRARFEEDMRLSAPISVGYDIGSAGAFEHQYMQRPDILPSHGSITGFSKGGTFGKACGGGAGMEVKLNVAPAMTPDETYANIAQAAGLSVAQLTQCQLDYDPVKLQATLFVPPELHPCIEEAWRAKFKQPKPRAKGRYVFTDVKARISTPNGDFSLGDQVSFADVPPPARAPTRVDQHTATGKDLDDLAMSAVGIKRHRHNNGLPESDEQFRARLNYLLGL